MIALRATILHNENLLAIQHNIYGNTCLKLYVKITFTYKQFQVSVETKLKSQVFPGQNTIVALKDLLLYTCYF